MEEQKIKRWLNGLGKRTFVLCFKMFQSTYKNVHYLKVAELIPLYDALAQSNDPKNTLPRKATYAIDLFEREAEIEALKMCIRSKKLAPEVIKLAKKYLNEYNIKNIEENVINFQEEVEKQNFELIDPGDFEQIQPKRIYLNSCYQRDVKKAAAAKIYGNFNCIIDKDHKTFISSLSGKPYVEAHHIIPMRFQSDFNFSLDELFNIVAICPNCHRALHNARYDMKKKLLATIYEKRINFFEKLGINITLDTLFTLYK